MNQGNQAFLADREADDPFFEARHRTAAIEDANKIAASMSSANRADDFKQLSDHFGFVEG